MKPEYRPNPEPAWVKETLCEDFATAAREAGAALPDSRLIESAVNEDLRRHEARKREGVGKRRVRRADPAAELARESKAALRRSEYDERAGVYRERRRVLDLAKDQTPWHLALRSRMMELLRRGGESAEDFLYPNYARAYLTELVNFKLGSGEYRRLTQRGRQLRLSRMVEDIADRSNAIPGLGDWRRGT